MSARCDAVRALAPEIALDLLSGPERADALAHLETCASCRGEVAALTAVGDALLGAAPLAEPPAGLEGRVLDLLSAASAPRRPRRPAWRPPAAAAGAAAVLGLGAGLLLGGGSGADVRTASLVTADGGAVGRLVILDDDHMVCVFDDTPVGAPYTVEVLDGDTAHPAGDFESPGGPWSWSVRLPIDGDDVDRVVLRGAGGEVRLEAEL